MTGCKMYWVLIALWILSVLIVWTLRLRKLYKDNFRLFIYISFTPAFIWNKIYCQVMDFLPLQKCVFVNDFFTHWVKHKYILMLSVRKYREKKIGQLRELVCSKIQIHFFGLPVLFPLPQNLPLYIPSNKILSLINFPRDKI